MTMLLLTLEDLVLIFVQSSMHDLWPIKLVIDKLRCRGLRYFPNSVIRAR